MVDLGRDLLMSEFLHIIPTRECFPALRLMRFLVHRLCMIATNLSGMPLQAMKPGSKKITLNYMICSSDIRRRVFRLRQILAFLVRVQRAGDVVLTRPVFVIESWLDSPYDSIPRVEWNTFLVSRASQVI